VEYYNLDAILSVGYRVNSKKGTQFSGSIPIICSKFLCLYSPQEIKIKFIINSSLIDGFLIAEKNTLGTNNKNKFKISNWQKN
jgi:hypothetical protein